MENMTIPAVSEDPLLNTQRSYPIPNQSQILRLRALSMESADLEIGSPGGEFTPSPHPSSLFIGGVLLLLLA